jgi:hypothetical protein
MPTSLLKLPIRLTASYLRFAGAALRGLAELIDSSAGADAADGWAPAEPMPDAERPESVVPDRPESVAPHSGPDASRDTPRPRAGRAPAQRRPSPAAPGSGRPRRPAREADGRRASEPEQDTSEPRTAEPAAPPAPEPAAPPAPEPSPPRRDAAAPPSSLDPASGHVSEEAVLVGESADPGAADGAGPEIRVDEPWDGYRAQAAADVVDRLGSEPDSAVALVQLYEQTHRRRRTVLAAAERELRRRNPPGSGSRAS